MYATLWLEIEQCSNRRRNLVPEESSSRLEWHRYQKQTPEKWSRFMVPVSGVCVELRPFREEPWHLHYVSWLSMHSALPTYPPPFVVRSLQLVEVRPYAEKEEDCQFLKQDILAYKTFPASFSLRSHKIFCGIPLSYMPTITISA